ncbi:MAG: hypothetical protein IMY80_05195, partial [Chloroflexi bacterium]|nr:hypothetical protein [Chloroflexota bacterium]
YKMTGATFAGVPIFVDTDCPINRVFFLDSSTIAFKYASDRLIGWIDKDGLVFRQVPGKDGYKAHPKIYGELACRQPAGNGRIDDIDYDPHSFIENRL